MRPSFYSPPPMIFFFLSEENHEISAEKKSKYPSAGEFSIGFGA